MQTVFTIGRRFSKYKYLSVAANSFVVFTFYFIYRYLFGASFPQFAGMPLALIFVILGLIVAKITLWAFGKYAAGVSYQLTQSGLLVRTGSMERLYRWEDFRGAQFRDGSFQNVFPVEFQVGNEPLMLNQHLDGLCRLTYEIFLRIQDHVSLDPQLVQHAKNMLDVY